MQVEGGRRGERGRGRCARARREKQKRCEREKKARLAADGRFGLWNPNVLALIAHAPARRRCSAALPRTQAFTPPNSAAAPFMPSSVCVLAVALLVLVASARAAPAAKLGAGKWFDRVLFMLFENHSEQEVIADPNFR